MHVIRSIGMVRVSFFFKIKTLVATAGGVMIKIDKVM